MGKKPVFALVGLVWAGIALTGCGECSRSNCRNKYNNTPTYPTQGAAATPGMLGDARDAGAGAVTAGSATAAASAATSKPGETPGTVGFATSPGQTTASAPIGPGGATTSSASLPVGSPTRQNSLRMGDDLPASLSKGAAPLDEGSRMPSLPVSTATSANLPGEGKGLSMPPRPIIGSTSTSNSAPVDLPATSPTSVPTSTPAGLPDMPAAGSESLPPIGGGSSLPPPPAPPVSPPPPAGALPPPPGAGSMPAPSFLK